MSESEEEFESADEGENDNKSGEESDSRGDVEEDKTAGIMESVGSSEENLRKDDMATGVDSLQLASEPEKVTAAEESEEEEDEEKEKQEEKQQHQQQQPSVEEKDTNQQESSNTEPNPEVPKTTVVPQEEMKNPQKSWGGWTSFGASIFSTATSSISTLTSQVEGGLQAMLEKVESSVGVPHPEELAKATDETTTQLSSVDKKEDESASDEATAAVTNEATSDAEGATAAVTEPPQAVNAGSSWFSTFGIDKIVSGGLGVLETVGRKTMDVISDTDPKLKKTRSMLTGSGDEPTLAQVLREAKSVKEEEELRQTEMEEMKRGNFRALFEDMKGLAHFEALEILSKEAQTKIDGLMRSPRPHSEDGQEMVTSLEETFQSFEEDDDSAEREWITAVTACLVAVPLGETFDADDFSKSVSNTLDAMQLKLSPSKLIEIHLRAEDWLKELKEKVHRQQISDLRRVHDNGVELLAEMTARAVEIEHKIGEYLLLNQQSDESLLETTTHLEKSSMLVDFTKSVIQLINAFSTRTTRLLSKTGDVLKDPDNARNYITSVYLEASNSRTYVVDALQLLLPVFKLIILQNHRDNQ